MKRALQGFSLLLAISGIAVWLGTGAHRGWTKTSVEVKTLDVVTGIEGISNEKRFVAGVDFLGLALLGAGLVAGVSLLFRKPSTPVAA